MTIDAQTQHRIRITDLPELVDDHRRLRADVASLTTRVERLEEARAADRLAALEAAFAAMHRDFESIAAKLDRILGILERKEH